MPATTRSTAHKSQTHLEDFDKEKKTQTAQLKRPPAANIKDGSKRKHVNDEQNSSSKTTLSKKQKKASIKPKEDASLAGEGKPIMINRAPVLQLWAACVGQELLPNFPWSTHLSIGSAVSALCAVSKGRAIGKIEQPSDDPGEKAEKKKKKEAAQEGADQEVDVMGFKLLLQDGCAVVSGKPQKANEGLLKKKYGAEDYERAKKAMEEAIVVFQSNAKEGELSRRAFKMYEDFRPTVQKGQGGWGKKGELKLDKLKDLAERR